MEKFLFRISFSFDHKADGITIAPGIDPEMADWIAGAKLKVTRPDGKVTLATSAGISPDERLALCLAGEITIDDVPMHSEVYLISDETMLGKCSEDEK